MRERRREARRDPAREALGRRDLARDAEERAAQRERAPRRGPRDGAPTRRRGRRSCGRRGPPARRGARSRTRRVSSAPSSRNSSNRSQCPRRPSALPWPRMSMATVAIPALRPGVGDVRVALAVLGVAVEEADDDLRLRRASSRGSRADGRPSSSRAGQRSLVVRASSPRPPSASRRAASARAARDLIVPSGTPSRSAISGVGQPLVERDLERLRWTSGSARARGARARARRRRRAAPRDRPGSRRERLGIVREDVPRDGAAPIAPARPVDAQVAHQRHEPRPDGAALGHVLPPRARRRRRTRRAGRPPPRPGRARCAATGRAASARAGRRARPRRARRPRRSAGAARRRSKCPRSALMLTRRGYPNSEASTAGFGASLLACRPWAMLVRKALAALRGVAQLDATLAARPARDPRSRGRRTVGHCAERKGRRRRRSGDDRPLLATLGPGPHRRARGARRRDAVRRRASTRCCRTASTGEQHPLDAQLLGLLRDARRRAPGLAHRARERLPEPEAQRDAPQEGAPRRVAQPALAGPRVRLPHRARPEPRWARTRASSSRRSASSGWEGGVGVYPTPADWFVHADVGRNRRWVN